MPLIARFEKFSSYTCEVHPNFTYAEACKYYLLSALSSEASKFFPILYRIKREPESIKNAVSPCHLKNKFCLSIRTVFWIIALPEVCTLFLIRNIHTLFKDPIKLAKFYVAFPLVSTKGSKMKTIPFLLNTGE